MNYALIFAGGTGQRMNSRFKPKQFLELHGKPIIVYTLEHFAKHPDIEGIVVVCIESWLKELEALIAQYFVKKVLKIVPGSTDGANKSIFLGLKAMQDICKSDDIVLIHDGVRPLINEDLITANIMKVKECGNCITTEAVSESVVRLDDEKIIVDVPPRQEMFFAKAPQSFKYGDISNLYQRADAEGVGNVDSSHLCSIYGVKMFTVVSTPYNVKITTAHDYYIFRALFEAMENEQILGVQL